MILALLSLPQGVRISYRLRGMEQVLRAVEDINVAMTWVCVAFSSTMKACSGWWGNEKGWRPAQGYHLQNLAHLGQCNPCSFKLLESLGADSINPVRDLQIR